MACAVLWAPMPRPTRFLLFAVLLFSVLPAATAETYPTAFTIVIANGEPPTDDAPEGTVLLVKDDGDAWAWDLTLTEDYTVAEVRATGFDLDRAPQLLPEFDDSAQHAEVDHLHPHFFQEVPRDVSDVDGAARIVNYTIDGDTVVLRLGLTGPGEATLSLRRDVTPPTFTVGTPTNITHFSFLVKTTTDEFAFGDVRVRPSAGGDEVPNPTAVPALEQTYPVQGLDPATTYVAYAVFTDWSGNEARSPPFTVETAPLPVVPSPAIVALVPAPNSTVAAPTRITASIEGPAPIAASGIRLFVDKREIVDGVSLVQGDAAGTRVTVVHTPAAPLAPGRHSASVEVVDSAGGKALARWSFDVEGSTAEAPGPGFIAILAVGFLALARRS